MDHSFSDDAIIFKAFCDENRLQILFLLGSGEKCACKLLEHLNIGQPALSYHMKILVESGIVEARQEGKWTHYSISGDARVRTTDLISKYTACCGSDDTKSCCGG
jgi:ArsR family transcriptional regulator